MVTVDTIVDDILRRELPPGTAWNDARAELHPADRGGWTRGGITARSWGNHIGLNRAAKRTELNNITEPQAREFYGKRYVAEFAQFADPLRVLLVDYGVTTPHLIVKKKLQEALRDLHLYDGDIDGIVGDLTRAGVAAADRRELYLAVLDQRRRHYMALSFDGEAREFLRDNDATQLHFCRGWNNRVWEFVALTPDRVTHGTVDVSGHSIGTT